MSAIRHWDIHELGQAEGITELKNRSRRKPAISSRILVGTIVVAFAADTPALLSSQAVVASGNTFMVTRFDRPLPRSTGATRRQSSEEFAPDVKEGFSTSRLATLGRGLFSPDDDDDANDVDVAF
jgi:hypothetical protein